MWMHLSRRGKPAASRFAIGATIVSLATTVSGEPARAQDWQPDKNVEIITGASPGGGNDRLARAIQRILKDRRLVTATSSVINKPGGGNAVSWAYLNQHAGDGRYIAIANPNLLTNHITGKSPQTYLDFTPLAVLLSEHVAFAVKADFPIKSGKELLERLRKEPGSLSIAIGSALGGANHIAIAKMVKAVGGDAKKLKPVVFNAVGEAMTALLGGHVDAVSASGSNMVAHAKAGRIRLLGISAPRRLPGAFAEVPTWREQGADAVVGNWRGMIGSKGLAAAQIAFWDETLAKMAGTEEWKKEAETFVLIESHMNSRDTTKFFESQNTELKAILAELGLAR